VPRPARERGRATAGVTSNYYVRLDRSRNPHASDAVADDHRPALPSTTPSAATCSPSPDPGSTQAQPADERRRKRVRPWPVQVADALHEHLPALMHASLWTSGPASGWPTPCSPTSLRSRITSATWPANDVFLDPAARTRYTTGPQPPARRRPSARGRPAATHTTLSSPELISACHYRDADFPPRRWGPTTNVLTNTHARRYHHPIAGTPQPWTTRFFRPAGDEDQRPRPHNRRPGSPSSRACASWPSRRTRQSSPPRQHPAARS